MASNYIEIWKRYTCFSIGKINYIFAPKFTKKRNIALYEDNLANEYSLNTCRSEVAWKHEAFSRMLALAFCIIGLPGLDC